MGVIGGHVAVAGRLIPGVFLVLVQCLKIADEFQIAVGAFTKHEVAGGCIVIHHDDSFPSARTCSMPAHRMRAASSTSASPWAVDRNRMPLVGRCSPTARQ